MKNNKIVQIAIKRAGKNPPPQRKRREANKEKEITTGAFGR